MRARRKVSGTTKAAVVDKLRDLHLQLDKGITPKAGYTHCAVRQAAGDWLAHGLEGRSPKTIKKDQNVLEPILAVIGARTLPWQRPSPWPRPRTGSPSPSSPPESAR